METDKLKRMLDACYLAKRIGDLLPELSDGISPAYIQYLGVIHRLQVNHEHVKVSDISDALRIPRPGVTRTVKEMESKGYLSKYASEEDGRITFISITQKGEELSEEYDRKYYNQIAKSLDNISDSEAEVMINTIVKLYEAMQKGGKGIE